METRASSRTRGYPIEQLAENSTFLETAYLLIHGELPTQEELGQWVYQITNHTILNEQTKKLMDGFRYDAHPMGMFVSTIASLSTFYPESKNIFDENVRRKQIYRMIAKTPTVAAFAYRHNSGMPFVYPDNDLSYTGNFLNMLFKRTEPKYKPNPVLERALDILLILHADHEQNCSTSSMRLIGSAQTDPYCSMAGAAAALYGPLHGGANEAVLKMLEQIGSRKNIPDLIKRVKAGEVRLMGFGHRVYKNYDPRARIVRRAAAEVFEVTGRNELIDIAIELERIALEDGLRVEDVVRATSTARMISTEAGTDRIPSGTASDSVPLPIATEAVATAAPHEPVVPAPSLQAVVVGPAYQHVVTAVTLEIIVTLSPAQDVVAAESLELVVASASTDDIALRGAAQIIVLFRAYDRASGASPVAGCRKRSLFHDRRGQDDRERDGGQ